MSYFWYYNFNISILNCILYYYVKFFNFIIIFEECIEKIICNNEILMIYWKIYFFGCRNII